MAGGSRALYFQTLVRRGGTRCALETVSAFARKTDASDSFMEGLRKGEGERRGSSIETNTRVLFTSREITVEITVAQKGKFVVTLGSDNLLPSSFIWDRSFV